MAEAENGSLANAGAVRFRTTNTNATPHEPLRAKRAGVFMEAMPTDFNR